MIVGKALNAKLINPASTLFVTNEPKTNSVPLSVNPISFMKPLLKASKKVATNGT